MGWRSTLLSHQLVVGKFSFAKLSLLNAAIDMQYVRDIKHFQQLSHLALSRVFNLPVKINLSR